MRFWKIALILILLSVFPVHVFADKNSASSALASILFDMDVDNVAYEVSDNGGVEISFGIAVPEEVFVETSSRLKAHPDINGVLSTYGTGDYCANPN